MSNEKVSQLPTVTNALTSDIIMAIQGGISVQETLAQILSLGLSNTILNYAGNPNGNLAGTIYQFCLNTTGNDLYICTTTGSTTTAVWTLIGNNLITPAQGGTGVASPTAHTLPIAQGSSNFIFQALTNGQLLIGSTGADPTAATITAGTNISVSNGAGSITIAASGHASFSWTNVTGTTQAMAVNSGYLANNAGLVTLTLPTTAAQFSEIEIVGVGAGGWIVAQNASQQILGTGIATTIGAGGSIASTNRYNTLSLICTTANTTWNLRAAPGGILTIV